MKRKSTNKNLLKYALEPFTRKLISVAQNHKDIAYSEMDRWLEANYNFSKLYRNATGFLAGTLMNNIWYDLEWDDAPLLNSLLVRKNGRVAGPGAGYYLAEWYGKPKFKKDGARDKYWTEWKNLCEQGQEDSYAFGKKWDRIYTQLKNGGYF